MAVDIWGIGHCCQDNICVVEQYPPEDGSTHILEIDDSQGVFFALFRIFEEGGMIFFREQFRTAPFLLTTPES